MHVERIKAAAAALFGGGELAELPVETLGAALREAGAAQVKRGEGLPGFVDLMVETGLVPSKGAARRTINEGGAYLNNVRVEDPDLVPAREDFLGGSWLVLRVSDPFEPADGRADTQWQGFGNAVAYTSPWFLAPSLP